jgi:tetratricopeptide (TPR) repeat protein
MVISGAVRMSVVIAILLVAVVAEPIVRADKEAATPWSQGVPAAAQQRALQVFREGNVFFEQGKYTEAVAKYEVALGSWDHPNIRYNIAICLMNMRQPLAAWDHLQRALRFGDAPLGKRLHAEALTYVAVLESSLAELTVASTQPDVKIMVDGAQVLATAGVHKMKLLPGRHQLVATRPGFATDSRALDLPAGKPVTEQIALAPEVVKIERDNYERRWRWWVPWSVAGSSIVLGVTGGILYAVARSEIKQHDADFAALCPLGCMEADIPSSLKDRAASARRTSGVAIGLWAGAGALLVTGGVMAILNRPRRLEEHRVLPALTVSRDQVSAGFSLVLD